MKQVELYSPKPEDLWFREKMLSDSETMSYNAGYKPIYEGYHYESGCIDFPKEKWETWHKEKMSKMLYYYIKDLETSEFVGEVSCRVNEKIGNIGVIIFSSYRGKGYMKPAILQLIEKAKEKGLAILIDEGVPLSREVAIGCFKDLGFKQIKRYKTYKFDKEEEMIDLQIDLS